MGATYSLADLSDQTGIESRTIRSYIERGLLPNADTRGRTASYSDEHLTRLRVIQAMRRARPNITLSDVRILLQQLTPEQIHALAHGSITASSLATNSAAPPGDEDFELLDEGGNFGEPLLMSLRMPPEKLNGAERLVHLLRTFNPSMSPAPQSKAEAWQRITVTPDVELCVRAEFDARQLGVFRELADLLRHILQQPDALRQSHEG
jgi:DNA-binding transcriptional MerR regulator